MLRPRTHSSVAVLGAALAMSGSACSEAPQIDWSGPVADWPAFGGGNDGLRYSPLTQIDASNVAHLELAWSHTDDSVPEVAAKGRSAFQVNSIMLGETLYYCTSSMKVFALDATTGEERWEFDAGLRAENTKGAPVRCRGVSYWQDAAAPTGARCSTRILYNTRNSELIALDAADGKPCSDFGTGGRVSLNEGVRADAWEYHPTSPPLIVRDLAIVGALVYDNLKVDAASGVVRAFDVRSGELVWSFDPAPQDWKDRRLPGEDYVRGSPNVWSIMSADAERGLVFLPTGNPSPDFYGVLRDGLDHYGSSTVALDVETGKVVWNFQSVHHDLWDFDVPAQPELFQIPGVGGGRPGVLQPTKMGFIFLLDRETGEPLYPVEERPAPQGGTVPGEMLSATQPWPTHPEPIHPFEVEPWGFTPFDKRACEKIIGSYRNDGPFTPPSLEGSILYPHSAGGSNWGGIAVDPVRGIAIANQIHIVQMLQLIGREEYEEVAKEPVVFPDELYPMIGTPYGARRNTLLSPLGAPCNAPPWGSLTAVDLRSGKILWTRALGTTRDLAPFPIWLELGTPNFGGGIVTASELYFIGSTTDHFLRAFDVVSGDEIWKTRIPAQAAAIPSTYRVSRTGRQFIIVATGKGMTSEGAETILAYALPQERD